MGQRGFGEGEGGKVVGTLRHGVAHSSAWLRSQHSLDQPHHLNLMFRCNCSKLKHDKQVNTDSQFMS